MAVIEVFLKMKRKEGSDIPIDLLCVRLKGPDMV